MTAMPTTLNCHRAAVLLLHDGDTFTARLSISPNLYHEGRLRLAGINAPELATDAGKLAAAWAQSWLAGAPWPISQALTFAATRADWPLVVQVTGVENYGRLLVLVWRTVDGRCLNEDILAAGHAVPYSVKLALP
jgi:endonuclease YncB( thermonuclease family)